MAKSVIKATILIGGKVAQSLQKAFKEAGKQTNALDKAYEVTQRIGVTAFKAIASSVGAIGTAIVASAEATRDYRKDLAKMMSNAEMAGESQEKAWGGLEELYAMSGEFDSANEAMSNLLATGFKGKDLVKVIEAVNGATVKWQDTVNQEGVADGINETVMTGKAAGQFSDIIERSGTNIDTFNDGLLACNGLAERQQYVLTWLAKSGLTEVNAAYQEQNASLVNAYKADLKYQDAMAKLGEVADTILPSMKNLASDGITYFAEKLKGVDLETVSSALDKVGKVGKQAFDLIWEVLSKIDWNTLINSAVMVLTAFTNIFNFVVNNWSLISPIVYGIIGALVAYKAIMVASNVVSAISAAYKTAQALATGILTGLTLKEAAAVAIATAAQNGLNLAFLASPITWVVLLIAGLIAAIVLLYNKSDTFRAFWDKCWDGIKNAASVAVDFIVDCFNGLMDVINGIGDALKGAWDAVTGLFGKDGKAEYDVSVNGEKVANNAIGSTVTRPTLTWVGEGGEPETIVPHNNSPRSRALALEAVRGTGLNVGGNTYVFSPTIYANGGSTSDLESLLTAKFNEFKSQLEAYEDERRRLAY